MKLRFADWHGSRSMSITDMTLTKDGKEVAAITLDPDGVAKDFSDEEARMIMKAFDDEIVPA